MIIGNYLNSAVNNICMIIKTYTLILSYQKIMIQISREEEGRNEEMYKRSKFSSTIAGSQQELDTESIDNNISVFARNTDTHAIRNRYKS